MPFVHHRPQVVTRLIRGEPALPIPGTRDLQRDPPLPTPHVRHQQRYRPHDSPGCQNKNHEHVRPPQSQKRASSKKPGFGSQGAAESLPSVHTHQTSSL
ncbi:protein of unknown function [Streptomyces sp. KY75]|nr:protein of unknown function [Streptomyces sp. KY70]CAD5980200.1 protein of unknown function [Streptomyces sp. KY75]